MTKHTPAPWEATLVPTSLGSAYKFTPCRSILYVDGMYSHNAKDPAWDQFHADARLIAAAPDLLAMALDLQDFSRLYLDLPIELIGRWQHIANMAHAAIAKATGEQP